MSFRAKDEPRHRAALPFHSVATKEEAKSIMLTHCKLHYDGRYVLNDWVDHDIDRLLTLAEELNLT